MSPLQPGCSTRIFWTNLRRLLRSHLEKRCWKIQKWNPSFGQCFVASWKTYTPWLFPTSRSREAWYQDFLEATILALTGQSISSQEIVRRENSSHQDPSAGAHRPVESMCSSTFGFFSDVEWKMISTFPGNLVIHCSISEKVRTDDFIVKHCCPNYDSRWLNWKFINAFGVFITPDNAVVSTYHRIQMEWRKKGNS